MRRSLTSRLVVTTVALVLTISVLIATFTTFGMRSYLLGRLDQDVRRSTQRWHVPGRTNSIEEVFQGRNQEPGTLVAVVGGGVDLAVVLGDGPGEQEPVDLAGVPALAQVPSDGAIHQVELPGRGRYRVIARQITVSTQVGERAGLLVSGLPTTGVDAAVASLIAWEAGLILAGLFAASGAGFLIVRHQLRGLRQVAATAHEVAALPLSSGEIGITSRVPESLADEPSEVGAVGSALNTLLDQVEVALVARHRLEQQARQFVADASHELRTPLATIRGYADLASRRPETMPTAIAKVNAESVRMSTLVDDLLALARLDSGRPLVREQVDLTRLAIEAVSDARVVAGDHIWRLVAPERPVEVVGDRDALHRVIANLLTNAAKHTPVGTTVTLDVTGSGFTVHDDGPGFPPELLGVAFERFTRADTSRQRGAGDGGVGLGLSLVQAIVAAHGGTVSLASQPGDTRVSVQLADSSGSGCAGKRSSGHKVE